MKVDSLYQTLSHKFLDIFEKISYSKISFKALTIVALTAVEGYHGYSLIFWLYGLFLGGYQVSLGIYTYDRMRIRHFPRAWSFVQFAKAFPVLIGIPTTHYLNEAFRASETGPRSKAGYYFSAVFVFLGAASLNIIAVIKSRRRRKSSAQAAALHTDAAVFGLVEDLSHEPLCALRSAGTNVGGTQAVVPRVLPGSALDTAGSVLNEVAPAVDLNLPHGRRRSLLLPPVSDQEFLHTRYFPLFEVVSEGAVQYGQHGGFLDYESIHEAVEEEELEEDAEAVAAADVLLNEDFEDHDIEVLSEAILGENPELMVRRNSSNEQQHQQKALIHLHCTCDENEESGGGGGDEEHDKNLSTKDLILSNGKNAVRAIESIDEEEEPEVEGVEIDEIDSLGYFGGLFSAISEENVEVFEAELEEDVVATMPTKVSSLTNSTTSHHEDKKSTLKKNILLTIHSSSSSSSKCKNLDSAAACSSVADEEKIYLNQASSNV